MEDLHKLKQMLVDYTYNNKVLFEIELSKISDERLVIGLLVDIYSKIDSYEADRDIIAPLLADRILKKEVANSDIITYHQFYQTEMKKVLTNKSNITSLTKCLNLIEILKDAIVDDKVNPLQVPAFVDGVKDCNQNDIKVLKKFLLEMEMYDVIVDIEKIQNEN